VSHSLVERCRELIDKNAVIQGDIAASERVLRQSMASGEVWRNLFHLHLKLIQHSPQHTGFSADDAASAAMSPTSAAMSPTASRRVQGEQVWDESRVFAQMDAFMQRCADLLEVCEWRSQFSYRLACDAGFAPRGTGEIESRQVGAEEEEEVDDEKGEGEGGRKRGMAPPQLSPAFGGSRAKEMYARLIKIRAQFAEHMLALEHLSYDPLDVKAPWHADFSKLKVHVKDLEVMLNNVIASSFETVAHTLDAFNLQEGFQHLATRDSVKRAVDKRSQDMVNMWAEDINWVKKSLDKGRKNPPRHMHDSASQYPYKHPAPPYAGAAAWARMLLARIQSPYLIISKSHHLTVTKEYCEVLEQYKTVELAIQTFIDTQYQDWQNHMEKVFRGGEDLMNSNLIRRNPETQLLEVTFPQQVALLFKEVEMWNRIGYSIPFVAMENCKDKDRINCVRCSVRALVMDYNRNLSALELWERKVFSDKLKAVDRKIGPAVTRITWNSKGVVDFCKDASKQCGGVKVLIDAFKEHTGSIVQSCREISNLNLVQVQRKRIYTASEFEAVQATHREQVMETLGRLSADIKQNLKAIYQLFLTDGADSLREWERYILRVDDSIEKALSDGCKKSLHGLSRAINGDKKTESQQVPFFSVQIVLDSQNRVACTPSSNELMQMINLCAKELIGMLNVVPRLRGLVEAEVRAELDMPPLNLQRKDDTSISTCIANDEEVTKVMIAIAGGMSSGGSKLQKQVTYWEKYKHIWDYDKAAFIRRYAKGAKMSFEEDIKRYKDFHKEVSLEESQTQIGFISIDYSGLKSTIIWHCLDWQRKFTGLLNELALKDLNSVFEAFASTTEKLSATPKNLNELAEAGKLLKEQMRDLPAVAGLFEPIAAKYKMLEKFEVDVESSEIARLESLEGKYEAFKHFLNTTEKNLSACKRSMKVDLEKGSSSFEAETTNMLNTFKDEAPRSGEAIKTADALLQLQTFRQRLEKNRETEEDLRKGMEVFDQKLHVNDSMTKVEAGIVLLEELWGMRGEWEGIWDGYKSGKFADLKTDSMEETAGKFMKKIMMKRKDAGSTPLWAELKTAVDRFRATMPLITDLGNEDLQPRHWQLLMDQIGQNFDHEGDDFTLERVIDLRLDQHSEFIGTISASASKEYQVEKAIMDVEETWNTLQLDLVPYRDRGHYRIKTVEDLYAALDDNSVNLGALKANKFGKPFMGKIVFWEKTLSVISETLEMCQGVQKQWMYLENIFAGSEDIRRQLPAESSQFETCDAGWMFVMKRMIMHSTAKDACTEEGILEKLVEMNTLLEKIQKSLDAYLETKRVAFPRFYFVSADDLLEILGQARDPEAVQPHLKKCFDAIKSLKMDKGRKHTEASAMNSPEGEFVPFQAPVVTEGPVEVWMLQIEWAMRNTMHKLLYGTLTAMKTTKKEKWIADWPGQLLITSGQILWTNECEKGLLAVEKGNKLGLKPTKKKWIVMLNKYAELIRAGMNKQDRSKTVAVVTIEVHARDVIDQLMKKGTSNRLDFEWISQLRLSWEKDLDKCVVCQISAKFDYGCEYLGNCGRLVITPLTDRAYMTLTTALHLKRGGNPQGPAGTGKTETVKDLGKAIAKYVIVFNCSDGLDYKSMGRMFSGLAQTGAWSCFDEFNRIDIEVLSVVAQQILSILKAVTQGLTDFNFEGAQIKLDLGVGIFVTMNPGYAGRTELPDNLKAILRPISMMVPDMALIGEIMLFSEGFVMAKVLSKKMTGLFDLMKEQMSKQDHYDYGLRNTKSILVAAGALKRAEPEMPEDILLYRTIRDMQLPKLIAEDVPLFNALNSDFFPGLEIPPTDYGVFQKAIESAIEARQMQLVRITIAKIIQTYEVKLTRHGNMLVGGSFAGKSSAWSLLQDTHGLLKKQEVPGYEKVKTYIINPKSLSDAELYGQYDLSTGEWLDGVLSNCMRSACADEAPTLKWLILDGPVDTLWIESMNTVLDDNKLLTLVSGERISMPPQVSLLFEVQDLAVASPATVSRAGMVYYDPSDFGWKPYVASWLQKSHLQAYAEQLQKLFDQFVDTTLLTRRRETTEPVPCIELNLVRSLCNLVESVFLPENGIPESGGTEEAAAAARMWFVFCVVWSLGGAVDENGRKRIDNAVRECDGMEGSSNLPSSNTMYEWMVDGKKREWVSWTAKIPETWGVAPNTPFYKILVPTLDTVRYSWVVNALVQAHKEILIVGDSGVGKTFIMQECLSQLQEMLVSKVNFSAQTSSGRLQFIVEGKVEKRMKDTFGNPSVHARTRAHACIDSSCAHSCRAQSRGIYAHTNADALACPGPPMGKRMVLLIDDLNMPAKDLFGSQPPLELLRHWLDYGFW
jgi:dynein heavy chain